MAKTRMETKKLSLKYGAAAVVVALVIIGAAMLANPLTSPIVQRQLEPKTSFLIMLTDPPEVPKGTTQLNLTYSAVSLHVNYPDGTSIWLNIPVTAGKVDLISLMNVTQTIASLTLPTGTTVDKIQFSISSVETKVNGQVYPVTTLTNQLLVSIRGNGVASGTLSGVLLDLTPTLVEIQATNSTGAEVNYYVLAPSATAIVKTNIPENQRPIGARARLRDEDNEQLDQAKESASRNVAISSASLSVSGDTTNLQVILKNTGNTNATIVGIILHGRFNTLISKPDNSQGHGNEKPSESDHGKGNGGSGSDKNLQKVHPESLPFKVSGSSLVPLLSESNDGGNRNLILRPGQSVTLSFSGVLQKHPQNDKGKAPETILTPISSDSYIIRLMGEGNATYNVTSL